MATAEKGNFTPTVGKFNRWCGSVMTNLKNLALRLVPMLRLLSACSSHAVKFIHPQTGATAECSASGFGIGASLSEGFVSSCRRAYEERGDVRTDQLTAAQRGDLEQRGLMPNDWQR